MVEVNVLDSAIRSISENIIKLVNINRVPLVCNNIIEPSLFISWVFVASYQVLDESNLRPFHIDMIVVNQAVYHHARSIFMLPLNSSMTLFVERKIYLSFGITILSKR